MMGTSLLSLPWAFSQVSYFLIDILSRLLLSTLCQAVLYLVCCCGRLFSNVAKTYSMITRIETRKEKVYILYCSVRSYIEHYDAVLTTLSL